MAIKERDVVLMGKDGADGTIDLPVTRLGNIEDGAEVKTTLADADALPVVDSADAQEMKKITWANLIAAIKGKLDRVYAAVSHEHTKSEITDFPTSMTPTAHKDSHKTGGSDALTAADVGADPSGSAAAVDAKLDTHVVNIVKHITAAERTSWSAKAERKTAAGTLSTTGWTGSAGNWSQAVAVSWMLAADVPKARLTGTTAAQMDAWDTLEPYVDSAAGKVTFYCKQTVKPAAAMSVEIEVIR